MGVYPGKKETARETASIKCCLAKLEHPAGSSSGGKKKGARRG